MKYTLLTMAIAIFTVTAAHAAPMVFSNSDAEEVADNTSRLTDGEKYLKGCGCGERKPNDSKPKK